MHQSKFNRKLSITHTHVYITNILFIKQHSICIQHVHNHLSHPHQIKLSDISLYVLFFTLAQNHNQAHMYLEQTQGMCQKYPQKVNNPETQIIDE